MIVKLAIPTVNLVELSCKERDRHEFEQEIMADGMSQIVDENS
ncbi:hypothetical protein [Pseudoalteromonas rubra]|nr:hypothetical protein [Pseudoalteromonas rubra]